MSGKYTKEMHEPYRKEQDEKAAKEEQERRERTEKESARQAWLAEGGRDEGRRRVVDAARRAREESKLTPRGGRPKR
jgi:hypothetical protein